MAHHEEPQISESQISVHMLSAAPHGTYVEGFPDPERDPLWAGTIGNRPAIKDGTIEVPDRPGFGLDLDWDLIATYRLAR
jgi:D-galactarolactone cycloisomerase